MRPISLGLACLLIGFVFTHGHAAAGVLKTDVSKALVPLDEIVSGGPPPDGIPAIDRPVFVASANADAWLKPKEPVLAVELKRYARHYRIGPRRGDARLVRFINLVFRAFLPEIEVLQEEKERAIQRYRAVHGGAVPFEDRGVEILSRVEIGVLRHLDSTAFREEARR